MGYNQNREAANKCYERMKALVAKPGAMSLADEVEFNRLEREIQQYRKDQNELEQAELSKVFDLKNLNGWQRDKVEKLALTDFIRTGTLPKELMPIMKPSVRLAQQSTSTTSGGYMIPTGLTNDLEVAMKSHGGMWENARIIRTDRGNVTSWGTVDDTGNAAYIIDESGDNTADAAAVTFGTKQFTGFKYTSGLIQVPRELLQDSELFAEEFTGLLSERFFRGSNTHFTTGDGNDKPTGAVTSATFGVHTEADGDISADDILNLIYTVDTSYRKKGKLMMHSSVLKAIQKKSSSASSDKPFWVPPTPGDGSNGDPAGTVYGYPIVVNDDMTSFVGAETSADDNKKIMLFGNFSKYIIRQARDLRIVRFDERYADLDQVAFAVFMRVDGDILNAGTNPIKYMRVSTT